jgi:hypothetical protein
MTRNWRSIAELGGVGAVVVSLLLVVYEVRQTQISINVAAYQQLIERISEFNLATIENPEIRVVRDKVRSRALLSPDEASIFNAFLYLAYRNGDLAYLQYEQGMIDEQRLLSGLGLLINFLEEPIVQKHWKGAQMGFVESYRDYVNKLIDEINNSDARTTSGARLLLDASKRMEIEERK